LTLPGGLNEITGAPNRGFKVSAEAQGNVLDMCYYLHHMTVRVNRPATNYPQVTLDSVFSLKSQTQLEEGHKDPLTPAYSQLQGLTKDQGDN
jgi:hypothetical protein